MIDNRSYAHNLPVSCCEIKPEKYSGLNGIQTHDLWDTRAVLYQLSYIYPANWELATLFLPFSFNFSHLHYFLYALWNR